MVAVIAAAILGSLLAPPFVSTGHSQPAGRPHPDVFIATTGDRLTLAIRDAPWPLVLEEFRRRANITFRVVPAPAGAITASLENARVETVLRVLFGRDAGVVYVYRPGPDEAPTVPDEVWIALGRSAGSTPVADHAARPRRNAPRAAATSSDDNRRATDDDGALPPGASLQAQDPELRLRALDAVVERGDGSGVNEIRHVLVTDVDLDVRTRAVTALARVATAEALEALRQGLADPELAVRLSAVDAIKSFETPRARALLRDALRDRDEQVREVAAAALRSLRRVGP
jgi:hypothetical protein